MAARASRHRRRPRRDRRGADRIGLEVEGVTDPGEALRPFTVARILTAERHPQADKLQLLSVDAGDGPTQVVCGAPNARAGLVGVFGAPGVYVPGAGITLKVAAIRGVESNGMMCSARELQIGEGHDGIIELAPDAPIGASYAEYAGLTDPVIDVAITPNRQDCMGVRGIARDLAAAGLGTLRPLTVEPVEGEGAAPDVRTDDAEGCPAFYAQNVSGVVNGEAPEWMRRRLTAIGQKPISALVDITNYLSIDLGRPLHVYDRATLAGGLVARRARDGETMVALNGKGYALDASMTVIADDAQVHDIAGIMGGEASGVSAATTDVLIECAWFDPDAIARTGQKLLLTSDARQRFERGVDPAFLDDGLAVATRLVLDLCGGTSSPVTRAGTPPTTPRVVRYDPRLCATLGGLSVAPERQARILLSLGFAIGAIRSPDAYSDALFATVEAAWPVTVPSWRRDVDGAADLVEEVIRIEGIDQVPSTPLPRPAGVARPTATAQQKLERRVRRAAAARGLDEAVTWSFIGEAQAAPFGGSAWTLANPISEELKVMRPSLLPGLLAAAARNLRRGAGAGGVRLFEIGRRYLADAERLTLGLVLAGDRRPRGWRNGRAAPFDAYDAKAEALALLAAAGAPVDNLQVMGEAGRRLAPRPVGNAAAGAEDGARRVRHGASVGAQGVRPRRCGRGRGGGGRAVPRRAAGEARNGVHARGLHAARAPAGDARLRLPGARRAVGGGAGPRAARRRQGGDRRRAAVRPVRQGWRAVDGSRGDDAAGGAQLHRGRIKGGVGQGDRGGGEAGRGAAGLVAPAS